MKKLKNIQPSTHWIRRWATLVGVCAFTFMPFPADSLYQIGANAIAQSQGRQIEGIVSDETGEPMIGATVQVKGTSIGSITNIDGKFQLTIPASARELSISYIGYTPQTIAIGTKRSFTIKMESDTKTLDEFVTIGYGTVKKRDLTGAVSSVKSEDITLRPGPNPIESIQGRIAGLDITRASGQPGAEINIQLRGNRSFTADGTPLFLIDGMPGDYASINPNDIESIEVLKDASSTAVYGSAGSNGVIIITTKNGKAGKLSVDFNTYLGYNGFSTVPTMRTGDSYIEALRDANKYQWNAGNREWTTDGATWQSGADDPNLFGGASSEFWQLHQQGAYINWAKELMQTSYTQNYSLSVSGGNEKTKGYVSFNYSNDHGQYKNDDYQLYSTNMRIDHNIRKWITIGSSLQASYVVRDKAYAKLENALAQAIPLGKIRNDDGTIRPLPVSGANLYNLLLNDEPGVYQNSDNNFKIYVNPYVEIKPLKGLTFLSRATIWMNYSNNYLLEGIGSYQYYVGNGNKGRAQIRQNRSLGLKWENILTYNFQIAKDHDFTITGVTSWSDSQNIRTTMAQNDLTNNGFKWYNFKGDANTNATSDFDMEKGLGYVGRINYSYLGKYLFAASVRYDGASALHALNRWDTFPAFSAAWRISDESFMSDTRQWLDNLKLRIGYGVTGSAKISPYSSVSNLDSFDMALGGSIQSSYRYSKHISNPNLGWEKSYSWNFGVDMAVLKNRIDLSMEYYNTDTKGVIWAINNPIIYGGYTPGANYTKTTNICSTNNKGFELTLNTRNIVTKDFNWTSSFTFSTNKEEIISLTDGLGNNIAKTDTDYTLTVGQPINSYYNYKLDGVWQTEQDQDAAIFSKRPGDLRIDVPGMVRLEDGVYMKEIDGVKNYYYTDLQKAKKHDASLTAPNRLYGYSSKDYQILGHNSPDFSIGFQNGLTYKGFDLSIFMYMRFGQMIKYSMLSRYDASKYNNRITNIPEHFNYWTPTNPSNDFPVMNKDSNDPMLGALAFVDGSFFKIKNITIGYSLPQNLLKKAAIQKCRFYATITNPLVLSRSHLLKQYDPESNGNMDYPLTRQVVVGLNLSF